MALRCSIRVDMPHIYRFIRVIMPPKWWPKNPTYTLYRATRVIECKCRTQNPIPGICHVHVPRDLYQGLGTSTALIPPPPPPPPPLRKKLSDLHLTFTLNYIIIKKIIKRSISPMQYINYTTLLIYLIVCHHLKSVFRK